MGGTGSGSGSGLGLDSVVQNPFPWPLPVGMNFGRRLPLLALGHFPGFVGFDELLVFA